MRKRLAGFFALFFLQAIAQAYASLDTRPGETWDFIQSVGGIKVGTPTRGDNDRINLPVDCDVSGRTEISLKPTLVDPTLTVELLTGWVNGNKIQLTIRSGKGGSQGSPRCDSVMLGALDSGDYEVYYLGSDRVPHFLSTIKVPW
jgi:hypothetical protein